MPFILNTNIKNDVDGYVVDSYNVKGGYIIAQDWDELDDLTDKYLGSTIINGTLAYVVDSDDEGTPQTYRWSDDADDWIEEATGGSGGIDISTLIDELADNPELTDAILSAVNGCITYRFYFGDGESDEVEVTSRPPNAKMIKNITVNITEAADTDENLFRIVAESSLVNNQTQTDILISNQDGNNPNVIGQIFTTQENEFSYDVDFNLYRNSTIKVVAVDEYIKGYVTFTLKDVHLEFED